MYKHALQLNLKSIVARVQGPVWNAKIMTLFCTVTKDAELSKTTRADVQHVIFDNRFLVIRNWRS